MKNITARSEIIIKRLCAQLGFAASTVTAYCEKFSPDIFGHCRKPLDAAETEFYGISNTLSEIADAVARLCEELWANALSIEEKDPTLAESYRKKAQIAISSAELFEELSVSIYSRISHNSQYADINVAALRRDAAGFITNLRDAVKSISES